MAKTADVVSPVIQYPGNGFNREMDNAFVNEEISIGEFLSTALKDPALSFQNERIRVLNEPSGGVSFIEDPEVRVTIDKFESSQQKYALRVKPRGWDEIKSDKAVLDAAVNSNAIELDTLLHTALKNRYTSVVNFLYFHTMKTLHEELNTLYEDWERVLKRHVDTPDFDAGELADMENQRMSLQIDLMDLKNQENAVSEKIRVQSGYGANVSLNAEPPLPIGLLSDRIPARNRNAGHENIYLAQAKTDVATADAHYQLEVAKEHRLITFVETAYDAADDDGFDDAFSIQFGFSIPIGSGSKDKLLQRKMARMKSRNRKRILEQEINQTIPVMQKKLHNLIEQYTVIQQGKSESFSTAAFDRLLHTEGTDPLTLLKLKKGMIETQILQAKLSRMIFTTYIDLLDISGKLSEKPLVNYLSPEYGKELVQ